MTRLAEALRRADDPSGAEAPPSDSRVASQSAGQPLTPVPDTLRLPRDDQDWVEALEIQKNPTLGVFHGFSPNSVDKLVVTPTVPHAAVEQYRKLAASLHHAQL